MAPPRIHGLLVSSRIGRRLLSYVAVLLFILPDASAQSSNAATVIELSVDCLAPAVEEVDAFTFQPPARYLQVQQALLKRWADEGKAVYLTDTLSVPRPRFRYDIPASSVTYELERKRKVRREVQVHATATLVGADGEVLRVVDCPATQDHVLARKELAALRAETLAETNEAAVPAGFSRRVLEPALAVTATALGVYLFFTLRSEARTDS